MNRNQMKLLEMRGAQAAGRAVRVLPIKSNRIIFMSHRGASQYSDSPMYLTEYLLQHYPGRFEIIWEVNDPAAFSYLKEKGIRLVKYSTPEEFLLLNTSKVCVTNCGFRSYLQKRRGQLRINTWHGGGAYKAEAVSRQDVDAGRDRYELALLEARNNLYNLMLSSCALSTRYNIRKNFRYRGTVWKSGLPRNDIMFGRHDEVTERVRQAYGLKDGIRMLLLAPTWKSDGDSRNIELPYRALCEVLRTATGEEWRVLLRMHHLSEVDPSGLFKEYGDVLLDATPYPDVQELLFAADMLITDYSSLLWDFALTGKPVVLYTPDLDLYKNGRGFNVPVEDWRIPYARTYEELRDILLHTSMEELSANTALHLEKFGSYEKGRATADLAELIVKFCSH